MRVRLAIGAVAAITLFHLSAPAHAVGIVQIGEGAFNAGSGLITFSEFPLNTNNPTYLPTDYGGGAGSPTVTFGGFFLGQHLSATPGADCPGGASTGCVVGNPSSLLTLDPNSPHTFITNDGAAPRSPVLSGNPQFNGPVAIEFSTPQSGVGLVGGFFNAIGGTKITAYDINGNVIGTVVNDALGLEFLGLVTNDGSAVISGLEFSLIGAELAGFAVDDIRFGVGEQVSHPVPGPIVGAGLPGLVFASGSLLAWWRGRRRKSIIA